ncbi:hypothetical protein MMYC01_206657, partial [Madurella mycetomatis]
YPHGIAAYSRAMLILPRTRRDPRGQKIGRSGCQVPAVNARPSRPVELAAMEEGGLHEYLILLRLRPQLHLGCHGPALSAWSPSFPQDPRPPHELMQVCPLLTDQSSLMSSSLGRQTSLGSASKHLWPTRCSRSIERDTIRRHGLQDLPRRLRHKPSHQDIPRDWECGLRDNWPSHDWDLFFVHERGSWMAIYRASLTRESVINGITGGYIADKFG